MNLDKIAHHIAILFRSSPAEWELNYEEIPFPQINRSTVNVSNFTGNGGSKRQDIIYFYGEIDINGKKHRLAFYAHVSERRGDLLIDDQGFNYDDPLYEIITDHLYSLMPKGDFKADYVDDVMQ